MEKFKEKAVKIMPELPETETIKSVTEPQLKGLTIKIINLKNADFRQL